MLGVVVVYLGLIGAFCGAVSLIKPPAWIGVCTRRQAGYLLAAGLAAIVAGGALPAKLVRVDRARTRLDEFVPAYQFHEFHSIRVAAPKEKVYVAIKAVTAGEIPLFQMLTWIRRGGRSGPAGIMNAPADQPILDVATRTSFLLLAEEPNHEIVVGTAVIVPPGWRPSRSPTPDDFKAVHEPGFAVAAMNFLVEADGPAASIVTTETRVYATDASSRRRFIRYWRLIYPGSALIRRMWLRAIARRAESSTP